MLPSPKESRRDVRVPLNVQARIRDRAGVAAVSVGLLASDVSQRGMCLEGNVELVVGSYYDVELKLPDGAGLAGTLKVVWKCSGPNFRKFGAQWARLDMWSGRRLKRYVCAYGRRSAQGGALLGPAELFLLLAVGLVWFKVAADLLHF
ncbi:MAG: PilZ domain-containing protein [Elusimicrobiota bacterium]